jgi:hypothetical protein
MAGTHIVVATPCYSGVTAPYMISVMRLGDACRERGIGFSCHLLPGVALITLARAKIITDFLAMPSATHLLSVDADIGFEPQQAFRLLAFDVDFAAAAYPVKDAEAPRKYVVKWPSTGALDAKRGFAKIPAIGAGFMLLKRAAIVKLCDAYPELAFSRLDEDGSITGHALYDTFISPEGGYIGEDYAFCHRWTALGGEIWLDLNSKLSHTGTCTFNGDLRAHLAPIHSK